MVYHAPQFVVSDFFETLIVSVLYRTRQRLTTAAVTYLRERDSSTLCVLPRFGGSWAALFVNSEGAGLGPAAAGIESKGLSFVAVSRDLGNGVFCALAELGYPLVPVSGSVLVRRYFSALNRFCILSPIVTWALAGYTLSSIRRPSLTGSERRTTQRFSMRLPLTVRWTTGAAVGETSTESRDVSSRGVYFFLSKDVTEGSPVEILLTLPNEITLAGPVRVRCLGRVQRTEPREEGAVGVVAAIERYEFLRGEEEK
jgi:hypothetical protein